MDAYAHLNRELCLFDRNCKVGVVGENDAQSCGVIDQLDCLHSRNRCIRFYNN